MKRRTTKTTAFSKLKARLEDAIAYHMGTRQLTVRDVELKPRPHRREGGARGTGPDASLHVRAAPQCEPPDPAGMGDARPMWHPTSLGRQENPEVLVGWIGRRVGFTVSGF
jgi:hypothetical protein